MKIIVIDDNVINLSAAKDTLGRAGHDLTTCDTYDNALELLEVTYNKELIVQKLVAAGFPKESDGLTGDARDRWWKAYYKFREESRNPYWDAVLVDLLMPAGRDKQGSEGQRFVGQLMPVGFSLVLLAAKNGAKYGAVVTVTNHHDHPASAMLDRLETEWCCRKEGQLETLPGAGFNINGCKVGFFHGDTHHIEGMICPMCGGKKYQAQKTCSACDGSGNTQEYVDGRWQEIAGKPCTCCGGSTFEPCYDCNKTGLATGKDWATVLESLQKG